MVGCGHAAIDRLLQYDLLDIFRREAALRQRRPHVQAKFIPLAKRQQGTDHDHPAGSLVEMRPGPDVGPCMTRDQFDKFPVEGIRVGARLVDPGSPSALRRWAMVATLA